MRRGMTLVELLFVLAVITLIAGLSLSALIKARQRAQMGACTYNLRQLIAAVHMYEDDWGTVPIETPFETPEGYFGMVQQVLYPYVHSSDIFLCPADFTEGRMEYAEDALGNPQPVKSLRSVHWKGREWVISYCYLVTIAAYQACARGNPHLRSRSPLFICDWHTPHFRVLLLARYDGVVEVTPPWRYRAYHALFEGGACILDKPCELCKE